MEEITPFSVFKEKPIFIMGFPKSGTTLLQALLDYHPQLVVFPEDIKFMRIVEWERKRGKAFSNQEKLNLLFNETKKDKFDLPFLGNGSHHPNGPRDYSDIDYVRFRQLVTERVRKAHNNKETLLALIESFYDVEHSVKTDKRAWVEKTTHNYHYFPLFKKWFGDDVTCLHVVRNPFDNYVSYRKRYEERGAAKTAIKHFCFEWKFSNKLIKLAQKTMKNYHVIEYDELVTDTEKVMRNICTWIEIKFDASLLTPTINGKVWSGNSMHDKNFSSVSRDSLLIHKKKLTDKEQKNLKDCLSGFQPLLSLRLLKKVTHFKRHWGI